MNDLALITVHFAPENMQSLDLLASIFGAMTWEKTDEDSAGLYYQAVFETADDQQRYIDALDRDPEFAVYWLE